MRFSPEITLTAQHYSLLRGYAARFQAANAADRSTIIQEATDEVDLNWFQDVEFDRNIVENVSMPQSRIIGPF
jgi:hypothetical protein